MNIELFSNISTRIPSSVYTFSFKSLAIFVTYVFQSESTLCSCLNAKELLNQNSCDSDVWSLSDSNEIWTHNHTEPFSETGFFFFFFFWRRNCISSDSKYYSIFTLRNILTDHNFTWKEPN